MESLATLTQSICRKDNKQWMTGDTNFSRVEENIFVAKKRKEYDAMCFIGKYLRE